MKQLLVRLPKDFANGEVHPARTQIFSQIDLGNRGCLPELHRLVTRTRASLSSLQATLKTMPKCPCKVLSSLPVAASQSFTVWSPEPEARVFGV